MSKILIFLPLFFILNCSFDKVVKHHGAHFLEKKYEKLTLKKSNKNDIIELLGAPSTKSNFDNDLWIYIEKKTTKTSLFTLGKNEILINKILILEIDSSGLLVKKDLLNKNDMKKLEFSKDKTSSTITKSSFVYEFLSSLRQKINDPLGKRKKR